MTNTTADQKVTRRSVVRVGANAAWAVPAIAVIGAAPAIACSTTSTGFTVETLAAARGTSSTTKKDVTGSFSIKNQKSVGALTPKITIVVTGGKLNAIPTVSGYGAGTGALTADGGTFTYLSTSAVAACAVKLSNISFSYQGAQTGGTVKVSIDPTVANNTGTTSVTDSAL